MKIRIIIIILSLIDFCAISFSKESNLNKNDCFFQIDLRILVQADSTNTSEFDVFLFKGNVLFRSYKRQQKHNLLIDSIPFGSVYTMVASKKNYIRKSVLFNLRDSIDKIDLENICSSPKDRYYPVQLNMISTKGLPPSTLKEFQKIGNLGVITYAPKIKSFDNDRNYAKVVVQQFGKIMEIIEMLEANPSLKNDIATLNDSLSKNEIKIALKQSEIETTKKQKQLYVYIMIGVIIVLFLMAGGFIYTRNLNLKLNEFNTVIQKQKIFVEEQKQEITDSIQYAQRIQFAILPTKENIVKAFPQSFILFKPKDIVSGDFYWFQEIENKKYIAACDCTGHGVPGALMSMVATDMLNEALVHHKELNKILEHTNKSIKTALKQTTDDESTRDGMDLALCCFDEKNKVLHYAGAYRPLWLIRTTLSPEGRAGEGFTLVEYKATKAAIGGLTEDNQEFLINAIQLQKGDTIYLSSDGFADQFSPADKKLMTKRFKEILLSIQHLTMPEQEKYLDKFITDWRGNMEQTDDVLVIGVRV